MIFGAEATPGVYGRVFTELMRLELRALVAEAHLERGASASVSRHGNLRRGSLSVRV
ncbi:MAG: hypothetical protein M3544_09485 [Pseudomonadota bacterium]|nr:hypothetical protein [Pseudomonadota bacterium]